MIKQYENTSQNGKNYINGKIYFNETVLSEIKRNTSQWKKIIQKNIRILNLHEISRHPLKYTKLKFKESKEEKNSKLY